MTEKNPKNLIGKFNSLANAYEIILKEIDKKNNSKDEKIIKVFEIFDELLPNFGVYYEIMKIVRKQLFDAVFSDQFTGSVDGEQKNSENSLQRLSYFSLYSQLKILRDNKSEDLIEEIKGKENEIAEKNNQLNELKQHVQVLEEKLKNLDCNVKDLEKNISEKNNEISSWERKYLRNQNEQKTKFEKLDNNFRNLMTEFEEKCNEIDDLSVFKRAYDEINQNFNTLYDDDYGKFQKKQFLMNRKNQVANDILNAKKLEEQLLTLINISTEEYDKFLEKKSSELNEKIKKTDENMDSNFDEMNPKSSHQIKLDLNERAHLFKEIEKEKLNFKKSITDLKTEYDMIVQHRLGLEEKLYLMEADRETQEYIKRQKSKSVANQNSANNSLLQGLEEHYEPIRKGPDRDQFGIQDRIFSKWACSMQTSSNGEIWFDCRQVKFCENCFEKTLICPHKLSNPEAVIQIPPGTQYLKFSRPKLQFNQFMVKRALDTHKKQLIRISNSDYQHSSISVLTNYEPEFPVEAMQNANDESILLLNEGNPSIGMPHNFQRIWYDFSQRTSFKRQVSRPFTYERTLTTIQQFLAFLHNKEVFMNVDPFDIVESLYEYFEKRYELEDIKFGAIYDFFSSINFYAPKSRFIEMFCHVLIGNLDRGILNYVLYLGEVIDKIEWFESEDVKIFFALIYPYCDDDDLDNLTLDFISFAENKINKKLVWDFIMMLILKKREYLINEMEFRLCSLTSNDYSMTEMEFIQAMEHFFFISDEKQIRIGFRTALAHCYWDSNENSVPVTKLAHISAYFCLMQIINELQDNINTIVTESRKKIIENEAKAGPGMERTTNLTEFTDEFIKISDIDKLAVTNRELSELM